MSDPWENPDAYRKPVNVLIEGLAMEDATVHSAVTSYRMGMLEYTAMLESLVVVLATEKKGFFEKAVELSKYSTAGPTIVIGKGCQD